MTFTELIIVPAYLSGVFLIAALAQLLLGAPWYAAITSIVLSASSLTNYVALVLVTRQKVVQGRTRLSKPLLGIRWVLVALAAILVTLPLAFVLLHQLLAFERPVAVLVAAGLTTIIAFFILWRAPRELPKP